MPDVAGDRLKSFVDHIEALESEKSALADDIKQEYLAAKAAGFDVKVMRKLIALRRRDADEVAEEEALIETYKAALGMLADTPLGQAATVRQFPRAAE